jgi:PAS domain S-box-containing protein
MHRKKPLRVLLLSILGLAACVAGGGAWLWQTQERQIRRGAEAVLESIAELKAGQIAAWRSDQLRNGAVLMDDPLWRQAVSQWMALGRAEDAGRILAQFRALQKHYHYLDILLADASGRVRLRLGGVDVELHPESRLALGHSLRGQLPLLTDLHAGPGRLPPHVDIVIPFFSQDGELSEPVGAVFLLVDARRFLFPMLRTWPVPSRSAETLLARREPEGVLILNDLRHRRDAELSLRVPLPPQDGATVMAAEGRGGVVEGKDYRGVEVLAALKEVPESPWFMVSKVDAVEVLADWRSRSALIAALTAIALIAALAAAALIWQRERASSLQTLMQAQAALKESEARFRGLFQNAINGVAIHEIVLNERGEPVDYVFLDANPSFETHTGLRTADVLGRRVTEVLPGIEKSGVIEKYGSVALGGPGITFELFSEQLDRHYSVSAFPVGPARFATVFQDITTRKKALDELAESESRLRAITDSAQDAILMMDGAGRISYWNPAAERILGYSRAEAHGQELHALIAPERFRAGFAAAFPAFSRTGGGSAVGKTIELQALHKAGHEIAVDLSLSAVKGRSGWQAVGILRDITARKQAEEALRRTNRELEEATLHANEMALQAEMASAAKSEFLANMSHEIRTPMNGVIGMTGLLLDTGLTAEQRRFAEIVRSSAESLLGLINDILDFSKIEARKMELEKLDFDLRVTVEDAIEILADRAHAKGLELVCLIAPEVPAALRGDPGRLRQMILNMAGNAIKFTPQGEVALRVGCEREGEQTAALRFEISDTGIGIPEDKLPLLFSAFTQVDGSTTRRFGGTGLGLAITKQLAELMGGQVGVTSRAGRGSTFWFTAVLEKRQPDPAALDERGDLAGSRVLVVDDNETNRLLLSTLLKSWGCRVEEACAADQALEALGKAASGGEPFDMAILDMLMPEVDGMALGRMIRNAPELRGTRLVMMTSLGERGQVGRLREIGFSGYLTKPVRRAHLRDCLLLVMGRSPQVGERGLKEVVTRHTVAESRKQRRRILLAEDNTTNQILALEVLKRLGYRADAVANGAEAVRAVESLPYDLVLMDCQMPEMDGFEATRRIRRLQSAAAGRGVPIIAMTAHALKGDRERCLEAGMNDYLSKPVEPEELARMLERWIGKEAAKSPQPDGPEALPGASAPGGQAPAGGPRDRPAAEKPAPAVFDREAFMNRVMGDDALAETLAQAFVADMPSQIEKLAAAAAGKDFHLVEQQAHRIRGAAANMGAAALEQAALAAEQAGRAGDADGLERLLPLVDSQFAAARAALAETPAATGKSESRAK